MSGQPNTDNYTLGKGIASFKKLNSDGTHEPERDLGNLKELKLSPDITMIEHYSTRGGMNKKDKQAPKEIKIKIAFTLDEISDENMIMQLLAGSETITQAAATDSTAAIAITTLGRYYDLGKRSVSGVTVSGKTAGTDFVADARSGLVWIPYDSTISTTGDTTFTFDCAAVTYTKLNMYKDSYIEGFFRFRSDAPIGNNYELQLWRVQLKPAGDIALIGDDWMTLGVEGEVLDDSSNHAGVPYGYVLGDNVAAA